LSKTDRVGVGEEEVVDEEEDAVEQEAEP